MKPFGIAIGIAFLALVFYVGSYYAMVEKEPYRRSSYPMLRPVSVRIELHPTYRFGGDTTEAFFAPCHAFDRWLRPDYWSTMDWVTDWSGSFP